MHELAISESIVAGIVERMGDARVIRVVLEIGRLSGIVPDSIRFCFDLCAEGTSLAGAELAILEPSGLGRCHECGRDLVVDDPLATCPCGSVDLEVSGGREIRIKEVEVL